MIALMKPILPFTFFSGYAIELRILSLVGTFDEVLLGEDVS
jgi:hypothetical protein